MRTVLLCVAYLCGLFGSILLWKFGLPQRDINKDGHITLILEQEDEIEKKQWKRYNKISHFGIILIGLSFLLQIISLGVE